MLFPTIQFAIFFPIVFVLSWLLRPYPTRWKVLMVIASYTFYGWWDWHYVFLLGGSTIANQLFARLIAPSREPVRRVLLIAAVTVNIGVLALLQVLRLLHHLDREQLERHRRQGVAAALPDHPADRHLVLHVPGDQLRRRHLPGQGRTSSAPRLRGLPLVLPASRRRPDRAGRPSSCPSCNERPTLATSTAATRSGSSSAACSRRS